MLPKACAIGLNTLQTRLTLVGGCSSLACQSRCRGARTATGAQFDREKQDTSNLAGGSLEQVDQGSIANGPYHTICGFYKLSNEDRRVFSSFVESISRATKWVILVGTLKVCYSLWCLAGRASSVSLVDVFLLFESYSMAGVLILGRSAFAKLSKVEDTMSDIPIILEGMSRLGIAFLQIGAYCGAVTLLQAMQAASQCPSIIPVCSGILIGVAAARGTCLTILMTSYQPGSGKLAKLVAAMQRREAAQLGYPLWGRLSVRLAAGTLLGYTFMSSGSKTTSTEYEFSETEENIIRMCIDSMRIASLAMAAEIASYIMLGVCAILETDYYSIFDVAMSLIDSSLLCGIMFTTSNYFDRVISSEGRDITQLMNGFGHHGMAKLFEELAEVLRGLFIAGLLTIFVTNGPLGTYKNKVLFYGDQILNKSVHLMMGSSI